MNHATAVFLLNDKVRAVMGTYEDTPNAGKTLFKTLDPTIKVGDYVVVPTDTRHKMTVNKITDIDVSVDYDNSPSQIAWVISKIERDRYEAILKDEQAAIETVKTVEHNRRRDSLRNALVNDAPQDFAALRLFDASKK